MARAIGSNTKFYKVAKTEVKQEVDFSFLPRRKRGTLEEIEWEKCKNNKVYFKYKDFEGYFLVTYQSDSKVEKRAGECTYTMLCEYDGKITKISTLSLKKPALGRIVGGYGVHSYQVGEQIRDMEVLKLITSSSSQNIKKSKSYLMLCLKSNEVFECTEIHLNSGGRSPYVTGRKFWRENSLLSREDLLPYIYLEEDKNLSLGVGKKILCECTECKRKQYKWVSVLTRDGFNCEKCSLNISYPERFLINYLEVKKITYIHQKNFKSFPRRRFDFFLPDLNMLLETHGGQHYYPHYGTEHFERTQNSDKEKRIFAEQEGVKLIELNCSRSSPDWIENELKKTELPAIKHSEREEIIRLSKGHGHYDVKNIIKMFEEGKTIAEIALSQGVYKPTIEKLFKRINYLPYIHRYNIVCIDTLTIYRSTREASKHVRVDNRKITNCLKKRTEFAGFSSDTREKLRWEYYPEYIKNNKEDNLTCHVEHK